MCYNCGCGNPYDDMGNPDNIIEETLKTQSNKTGESLQDLKLKLYQTLDQQMNGQKVEMSPEIVEMFERAAKAESQTVEEAKKNTLDLLKNEVAE